MFQLKSIYNSARALMISYLRIYSFITSSKNILASESHCGS